MVPVAVAETVAATETVVTDAAPVGPVSDVHVTSCAVMATKWGLVIACPPDAFTRSLEAATAPEGTNGHP